MHVKPSFFRARQSQQETKWTSDHVGKGGKSSMGVLLDWLAVPGNYDRWRQCTRGKRSHQPLADEILGRLQAEGLVHRTASQVRTKIAELEHSYREAAERLASTKRELQTAEGTPAERNLRRVLERHCRYFALLQPIMQETVDNVIDSPPPKRPRLTTKRKVVPLPIAPPAPASAPIFTPAPPPVPASTPAPARAASTPPARKSYSLRERRGMEVMGEEMMWDFDNESVGGIRSPPTPPTPPTTRLVRKSKRRAMESISVMRLEEEEEEHQEHIQFRQIEKRNSSPELVKKRPALRSIEEIDLEKARVELTLRQLEVQMAQDKALVARAKARAQMLEHGVSRQEVERLMPLNV
ncbi:hypothetical protein P3T76_000742 [Phytophthora citrophthora]|uniref:Uncharacterized protein n=1 Tax=Phytophthora citrophthora TaxID=4793 RepID=A0AAD9H2D4_9STRA|nr:hypothetical protein P3T76_000742 [Phytophthora citrophthora]